MKPAQPITLAELLVVEDDAALLEFRCADTGILLWPLVRTVFFRMAMSDFMYGTPLDGSVSRGVPISRAIATLSRSILHNLCLSVTGQHRAAVCIMSSGVGNQSVEGLLLNRLSDHFALAWPSQTVTVEEHFHWIWPWPRHNPRVVLHAPLQAMNAVGAKLSMRAAHMRQATQLISMVADRAKRLLDWRPGPEREQELVAMLTRKIAGTPRQLRRYEAMLKQIRPKLLLTLAGCYGPSATLITAAKGMGIITAEYQHGTISAGHDGYNFAPTIRDSADFRAALPEHFLSYGAWWNDCINAPVRMMVLGNPHRDFRLAHAAQVTPTKENILILSDGTEFAIYLDLARQLEPEAARMGLRVVIRPHPLERSLVASKYAAGSGNIVIDQNDDLYASLITAHVVVSELSTGLFEAAGLADKLFVWDTPKARFGFPTFPFQSFGSAFELTQLLEDDRAGRLPASQVDAIWAPGWRRNYGDFLRSCDILPDAEAVAHHV